MATLSQLGQMESAPKFDFLLGQMDCVVVQGEFCLLQAHERFPQMTNMLLEGANYTTNLFMKLYVYCRI
jgi:hypothetical protein